jgi:hypothetical protein
MFCLKITFSMKIIFFFFFNVYFLFDLILYVYIQDFMIKKPNLLNMGGTFCIYNVGLPFN